MIPKSDKHSNCDAHNTLWCQILHQSGMLYVCHYFYSVVTYPIQSLNKKFSHKLMLGYLVCKNTNHILHTVQKCTLYHLQS